MLILREPADLAQVTDPSIRALMAQRFDELQSTGYEWSELGYFVLAQSGDGWSDLEAKHPFERWAAELIVETPSAFELVYVLDDSGWGITLWVPQQPESELTVFCRSFLACHAPT